MNFRKIAGALILSSFLFAMFAATQTANAIESSGWPRQFSTNMLPESMNVFSEDTFALVNCANTSQASSLNYINAGVLKSTLQADHVVCSSDSSLVTPDGSFLTMYSDSSINRIPVLALIKDNQIRWHTDLSSDPICSAANDWGRDSHNATMSFASLGSDGNIYGIIQASHSRCATYIAGISGVDGHILFKHQLTEDTSGLSGARLWTFEDKILTIDRNGLLRQFDYSGNEDTSKQYQFPVSAGLPVATAIANQDGRVFVVGWQCIGSQSSTTISYHDLDGQTGSMAAGYCSHAMNYAPSSAGNLVAYDSYGGSTVLTMSTANATPENVAAPAGYDITNVAGYWKDINGNVVVSRQLRKQSDNTSAVSIDEMSNSGGITNLFFMATDAQHPDPYLRTAGITNGYVYALICNNTSNCPNGPSGTIDSWVHKVPLSGFSTPIKDQGSFIDLSLDRDGDRLTLAQEVAQGTLDTTQDTDGDGLSDYTESQWFPNRNAVFCNSDATSCAYPDPVKKDLYLEVDWMHNPTTNEDYKPTATQLALVKSKYDALGINFHADTGQFGGGNQLPAYDAPLQISYDPNTVNYYSYKNGTASTAANFNQDRNKIWHYMISGYNFEDGAGSTDVTGKAEGGGANTFLSLGLIEHSSFSDVDSAVAGTIVHELGHNLCLTNVSYDGQATQCLYDGIDNDNNKPANYKSAMNYLYQFTNQYSYSDGTNGAGDHDDLTAINLGMDDFTTTEGDPNSSGARLAANWVNESITVQQGVDLQKKALENNETRSNGVAGGSISSLESIHTPNLDVMPASSSSRDVSPVQPNNNSKSQEMFYFTGITVLFVLVSVAIYINKR